MKKIFLIPFLVLLAHFAYAQEASEASGVVSPGSAQSDRAMMLMGAGAQYADEGEYDEAEQAYLRALESDPANDNIQFQLGTLYIQMGKYQAALDVLLPMAERNPESPVINNNIAWVYATGGAVKNGGKALYYAREAILSMPESPSAWNTLAEAHHVLGQYEQALRASEHAFELLRLQPGVREEDLESFRSQYEKIQRANESYKILLNLDEDE